VGRSHITGQEEGESQTHGSTSGTNLGLCGDIEHGHRLHRLGKLDESNTGDKASLRPDGTFIDRIDTL